jgi:sugar transferase (PEP-CTERM system associated)
MLVVGECTLFFILISMVEGLTPEAMTASALLALVVVGVMSSAGMYTRSVMFRADTLLGRAVVAVPAAAVAGWLALLAAGNGGVQPRAALLGAVCAVVGLVVHGVAAALVDAKPFKRRVLVLGAGARARKVAAMAAGRGGRVLPVGFVACDGEAGAGLGPVIPGHAFDAAVEAAALARAHAVDKIVIAVADDRALPLAALLECRLAGIEVQDFQSFCEAENGCLDLDALSPGWLIFHDGFRMGRVRRVVKACFDRAVAGLLLLLALPVLVAVAVAVKATDGGPVLFRQDRVGEGGKVFKVLKFRSMRVDAEKNGPQWAASGDDRVTAIGRFIRRTRIDEIPQVINVLKGEMSFIGPRPERPIFVEQLRQVIPHFDMRHRVKPGITGWAQINYPYGASVEDAAHKLSYDLYYLKNGSIFLDLLILVQTVRVVLFSEGAR